MYTSGPHGSSFQSNLPSAQVVPTEKEYGHPSILHGTRGTMPPRSEKLQSQAQTRLKPLSNLMRSSPTSLLSNRPCAKTPELPLLPPTMCGAEVAK